MVGEPERGGRRHPGADERNDLAAEKQPEIARAQRPQEGWRAAGRGGGGWRCGGRRNGGHSCKERTARGTVPVAWAVAEGCRKTLRQRARTGKDLCRACTNCYYVRMLDSGEKASIKLDPTTSSGGSDTEIAPVAAATPTPRGGERRHIPELDGLRGLAIFLVFVFHYLKFKEGGSAAYQILPQAIRSCWCGVDLFFVLSGFLITGILLDTKNNPRYFTNFYSRRTLRIFPLYFSAAAIIFLMVPAFLPVRSAADQDMLGNQGWVWFYVMNLKVTLAGFKPFEADYAHTSHLWSLAVEEHFYLVWPLIVYFASARFLRYTCVACIVGALALRVGTFYTTLSPVAPYVFTLCRVDSLAAGGLLSLAVRDMSGRFVLRSLFWPMIASACTLLVLFVWRGGLKVGDWPMKTFGFSLLAILFAGLIGTLLGLDESHPLRGVFRFKALRALGKYSYGLYVIHGALVPVFLGVLTTDQLQGALSLPHFVASVLRFALVFVICITLSLVSWGLIERYPLRLKRYF